MYQIFFDVQILNLTTKDELESIITSLLESALIGKIENAIFREDGLYLLVDVVYALKETDVLGDVL